MISQEHLQEIHDFWLGPTHLEEKIHLWFGKDPATDSLINKNFSSLLLEVEIYKGNFEKISRHIHDFSYKELLGLVLLLDQVPRHCFRNLAHSFFFDSLALELSHNLLKAKKFENINIFEKIFLYLPFQHSEKLSDQALSVKLFAELERDGAGQSAPSDIKKFLAVAKHMAERHEFAIRSFGRFPHRNSILGRVSTPQELKFLEDPRNFF